MSKFTYYDERMTPYSPPWIFVFGSNNLGIHGAGAAATAAELGYPFRKNQGLHWASLCYAIPTKDNPNTPLSLDIIKHNVYDFLITSREHPERIFYVTKVGCGLAGHSDEQIAPMFKHAKKNCMFHIDWKVYLD